MENLKKIIKEFVVYNQIVEIVIKRNIDNGAMLKFNDIAALEFKKILYFSKENNYKISLFVNGDIKIFID